MARLKSRVLSFISKSAKRTPVTSFVATAIASIVWCVLVLHAGPLVPVLGWVDFNWAAFGVMALIALILHEKPGSFGGIYGIVLFWFLLFFLRDWSTGLTDLCNLKMLIPVGDSAGHCFESGRLTHGDLLTEWGSHHQLSHGFHAAISLLSGQNLQVELLVMAVLAALALSYCTLAVGASFGALAGGLFAGIAGLFLFDNGLGTLSVETYGLTMGFLGTALLFDGMRTGKRRWQLAGVSVLSLGLIARMGAFFVLPSACLAIALGQRGWRKRCGLLAAAFLCVLAAFILNAAETNLFCAREATSMGRDFWHHLNGALTGVGWNGSVATLNVDEARSASLRLMRADPLAILSVFGRAIGIFFYNHTAFYYMPWRWLAIGTTWALSCGTVCCAVFIRKPAYRLVFFCIVGILLSTPFVPPWDAGIRPYAATIPLQAAGVAAIAGFLEGIVAAVRRTTPDAPAGRAASFSIPAATTASIIILLGLALPFLMTRTGLHFDKRGSAYYEGRIWMRCIRGTYIRIIPDDAAAYSYLPRIRRSDFFRGLDSASFTVFPDGATVLKTLPAGVLLTRSDSYPIFAIADDGGTLPEKTLVKADLVQLKGDCIAIDKRVEVDVPAIRRELDAIYLPWFTGYQFFYNFHPALGQMWILKTAPDGIVTIKTENYGVLETSRDRFPRLYRLNDGKNVILKDSRLLDEATGQPVGRVTD